jgi:UDP-GlcNAc3NAcA epimerase
MRIVTILGARPQFIKAAPVSQALRQTGVSEFLLHTGQHYDPEMSQVFFDELGLPKPDVNLGVGASAANPAQLAFTDQHTAGQAWQTGQMLIGIEAVLQAVRPDWALVYGDTNSTLAGALAAVKNHVPLAHIEAGLRSYNRQMPEEHNRVLTDHCADLLFCPTQRAAANLSVEGVKQGVYVTGDVMYDAVLQFGGLAEDRSTILSELGLEQRKYALVTIHRAYNTDDEQRLSCLLQAISQLKLPVVFPVHPRTQKGIDDLTRSKEPGLGKTELANVKFTAPLGYLEMLSIERNALRILTDSGGVQKEAYFFGVPCITLRRETEWVETIESGWNRVVDVDREQIVWAVQDALWPVVPPRPIFGDGHAAEKIVDILIKENIGHG